MKIIDISSRKNMLKLGNGETSSWYKISPSYQGGLDLTQTLKVGEEVTIKYNVIAGRNIIHYITNHAIATEPKIIEKKEKPMYNEKSDTQKSIERQVIGKITATTVAAIFQTKREVPINEYLNIIEKVYNKYSDKVSPIGE